ncbi:unnamed protein product [Ascophyllum nodosum]
MEIAIHAVRQRTSRSMDHSTNDRFLRKIELARKVFGTLESHGRGLTAEEIRALQRHGNWATDWSLVRVPEGHIPVERIRGCIFHGAVQLGSLQGAVSLPGGEHCPHPCGVYNSTLAACVVGDGALIKGCSSISRCVIGPGAILLDCGLISCSKPRTPTHRGCRFANGLAVKVGPETGGRELACYVTMRLAEAAVAVTDRSSSRAVAEQRVEVDAYAELASCEATVIGAEAVLMSCPRVADAFVGTKALLQSCTVEEATILSTSEEPSRVRDGSTVTSSLLQEGVSVGAGSIVSDSLLMEHSHVDNHGKLTHSILGPDSGVGAGECHHCLLGPFVGFHHQSLLIAAVWPHGRGNVAYGANVGSNHTSRQADQEIWPGEGVFFGLSSVIKFPANYSESPFSIVASGVACLPQRVAFPFCLINSPERSFMGVPSALNHLRPGWVLTESMYTIVRNEDKYRRRAKARRNRVDWPIFRPSTVRLMADARARLVAAGGGKEEIYVGDHDVEDVGKKEIYVGDRDVAGLGKNFMTEGSRREGIAAYTLHLRRYALRGLLSRLEASGPPLSLPFLLASFSSMGDCEKEKSQGGAGRMPPPVENALETARLLTLVESWSPSLGPADTESEEWELQQSLLETEYGGSDRSVKSLMEELISIEAQVAKAVETSKAKDDRRGAQVIPGYADAHTPAKLEKPVELAYAQRAEIERTVQVVMSHL